MKKKIYIIGVILCLFLCNITSVYAANKTGYIKPKKGAAVYIKNSAGEFKKVKTLSQCTTIKYQNYNKKWILIKYSNKKGFIKKNAISSYQVAKQNKAKYGKNHFKRMGVLNWGGWKWTWYSQRVLPGKGLKIPGRHVNKKGYVCDKAGYICLASSKLKKGTVVNTPFGIQGKVYDCGCAKNVLDVYVNW